MLKEASPPSRTVRDFETPFPEVLDERAISPLSQFIDYFQQMMPDDSFLKGARHAQIVISQNEEFLPEDVSEETIRRFLADMQSEYRLNNKHHEYSNNLDIEDIIKRKKGQELLNLVIPHYEDRYQDLVEHFKLFDNPSITSGALTVLTLLELEADRDVVEVAPTQMLPGQAQILKSA